MIPDDRRPPMLDRTEREFPIHVESPEKVHTGERYIEDLESLGLWEVDQRTFVRVLCTIGEEVRDVLLDGKTELVELYAGDRCTSWIRYENGTTYQVEFFLDDRGFGTASNWFPVLEQLTYTEEMRLLVVCDLEPTGQAKEYRDRTEGVETFPVISEPRERLTMVEPHETPDQMK